MNFQFFEDLSREEAESFLRRFLACGSANIGGILRQCSASGLVVDFSVESVAPLLRWITGKVAVRPGTPDRELPSWILETPSYSKNLFEFDDASKVLVLRAAYYMGASFVGSHQWLRWGIGNPEWAQANMPVVAGFKSGLELAPIMVAENLIARVTADPDKISDIDRAVEYWSQSVT